MTSPAEPTSTDGTLPTWRDPFLIPVLVAAIATAPATWWVLGRFATFSDTTDPDYLLKPPDISSSTELLIGVVSTLTALGGIVLVAWLVRSHRWSNRWLGVVTPAFAAFEYAGMTYRAITAPVIGANIGGGILILGAAPVALVLLGIIFGFARRPKAPSVALPAHQ